MNYVGRNSLKSTSRIGLRLEHSQVAVAQLSWKSFIFGKSSYVASSDFKSGWTMAIPAFATHMCIGSPYGWSAMSESLQRELGFVVSSASDWSLYECTMPISLVFAGQGISAALAGKWQIKVGPRVAQATASLCFGGGLCLGALGIYVLHTHQLWLLYLGYGILGGTGVGVAYTPPMQTLMEWYPKNKGFASGVTIAGFGSG
eukprot:GSMAST32.ASY1.ANO1.89.1 assembled CDS